MIEEPSIDCPYCGQTFTIMVDTTAGTQSYVEDCFVCCQPILLQIAVDHSGDIVAIDAEAENA